MTTTHFGYVITGDGLILLQIPSDNRWGFVLADDDQTWDGGFGVATEWEVIGDDDPRITPEIRDQLQCWLDQAREESGYES